MRLPAVAPAWCVRSRRDGVLAATAVGVLTSAEPSFLGIDGSYCPRANAAARARPESSSNSDTSR